MSLVKAVDLPQGFHAYEYTLTGYRIHYSTKGAILSIFDTRHNEFWMIWTDIFPLMYFIWMYICTCKYSDTVDLTIHSLYFGVISTRTCSGIYHVFSCMSVDMHNYLLYFDMAGISNMVFGTPVLYQNVSGKNEYDAYIYGIFTLYGITVITFIYCAVYQIDIAKSYTYCQSLLISLVAFGSIPLWITPYTYVLHDYYLATFFIVLGYMFYATAIPESLMKTGSIDGKLWNSHVIWHCMVSISQYLYIKNSLALI